MWIRRSMAAALAVALVDCAWVAAATNVRYYEKDGVKYCETRDVVVEQVPETKLEERTQTVYREQFTPAKEQRIQSYWTPVTENRLVPVLVGRWNPFVQPYYEYRNTQSVRWEQRLEKVEVPVVRRELVPATQVCRTPVTQWRTVEKEIITRTAVTDPPKAGLAPNEPARLAERPTVGGLSQLNGSPPRPAAPPGAPRATPSAAEPHFRLRIL